MVNADIRDMYKVILKKKLDPKVWPEQWDLFNKALEACPPTTPQGMPKPGSVELCRKYAMR